MTTGILSDLRRTLDSLQAEARSRGMVVCPQLPGFQFGDDGPDFPILAWEGTDSDYVDLARDAGARIFYVSGHEFEYESVLMNRVPEYRVSQFLYDEEDEESPSRDAPMVEGSTPWMLDRLRQSTHDWQGRSGELCLIQCVWLAEGVAHILEHRAQWFIAFEEKLQECIEAAKALIDENDRTESRKTADRIAARAHELARHPRFRDATSEAKRIYMAREIFGDDEDEVKAIAERATLDYWWAIEPEQKRTSAATVKKLHSDGVPVVTIAATVGLQKEKVNAILLEDR